MPSSLPPAPTQRASLFRAHPTPWTYGEDGIIRDAQGGVVMYDLGRDDTEISDGLYETLVLVMNSYCPMLGALQDVQKFCQEDSAVDPKVLCGIVEHAIATARRALECHRQPRPMDRKKPECAG